MTKDLIMRVSKINRQAALFMARKAPLLNVRRKLALGRSDELLCAFTFSETPQGFKYWDKIATQLGEW